MVKLGAAGIKSGQNEIAAVFAAHGLHNRENHRVHHFVDVRYRTDARQLVVGKAQYRFQTQPVAQTRTHARHRAVDHQRAGGRDAEKNVAARFEPFQIRYDFGRPFAFPEQAQRFQREIAFRHTAHARVYHINL